MKMRRCIFKCKILFSIFKCKILFSSLLQDVIVIIITKFKKQIMSFVGVDFTILRLPFWYENFYTVFRPHKVKHGVYALGKLLK